MTAILILLSMLPPPTNSDAASCTVMSILSCGGVRMSRNSRDGAVRINVFESHRLNLSDETASRCKAFRTGKSDQPLNGIIGSIAEGVAEPPQQKVLSTRLP